MNDSLSAPERSPQRRWWTPRRRSFAWLGFLLTGCLVTFMIVYRVTVHTVTWRLIDDVVVRGADLGPQADDPVAGVLDVVTVSTMAAAVAIVAIIALLRNRRLMGVAAVLLVVIANLLSRLLKSYVLTRPDLGLAEYTPATLNSLPSGHATAAFSVAAALMFVVPARLRPLTAVLAVAGTSTIAFATMFARWHRAADSVASFVLVTGVAAGLAIVVLAVEKPQLGRLRQDGSHSAGSAESTDATDPNLARSSTAGSGGARPRAAGPSAAIPTAAGSVASTKPVVTWPRLLGVGLLGFSALLTAPLSIEAFRDSSVGAPAAFLSAGCMVVGAAICCVILVMRTVERISPPPAARGSRPAPAGPAAPRPIPATSVDRVVSRIDPVGDDEGSPHPSPEHRPAGGPPTPADDQP